MDGTPLTAKELLRQLALLPPEQLALLPQQERDKVSAALLQANAPREPARKRALGAAAGVDSRRNTARRLAFPDDASSSASSSSAQASDEASGAPQPGASQGETDSCYDTESDDEDEVGEGVPASDQREIVAIPESLRRRGVDVDSDVQKILAILRHNPTLQSERWTSQLEPYVRTLVNCIHAGELEKKNPTTREGFTGGKVQSGKTMYKVIFITVCYKLAVTSFIASTYTHGTRSLQEKIKKELEHLPSEDRAPVINIDGKAIDDTHLMSASRADAFERLLTVVKAGGCIMVNDTDRRFDLCHTLLCAVRGDPSNTQRRLNFALALDEADAFQRTSDQSLKLERSLERFCEHRPLIKMYVTATLIPCFLRAAERNLSLDDIFAFYTYTDSNYNGLEDLRPLVADGVPLFIEPKELKPGNCYFNNKTDAFLRDALTRRMSLTLVITSSRVAASGGIFEQAGKVRALCPDAVRVTVDGTKGIRVYPPGSSAPRMIGKFDENKRKIVVSDVLSAIDNEFGDAPVVVLGYSQMIRGESFRSNLRVPTHIICVLGPTMSIEKKTQACGRAAFIGKDLLAKNGFDHVKILTMAPDYDTMQKYPALLRSIKEMLDRGLSFAEIFQVDRIFKYATNILSYQKRSIGQAKEQLQLAVSFEPPADGEELSLGHRHIVTAQQRELDTLKLELMEVGGSHKFRESFKEHLLRDELPGHDAAEFRSEVIKRNNEFTTGNLKLDMVRRQLTDLVSRDYFKSRKAGGRTGRVLFWKVPDASEGL